MSKFNGYKNWNYWNVSLWINNDEGLYRQASYLCRIHTKDKAAKLMYSSLVEDMGMTKTPDGAPYSVSSIRAAMTGL